MWDFLAGAPSCMQTLHCGAKMLNGTEKAEHHKASLCVSCVSKLQLFHMWLKWPTGKSQRNLGSWILNSDQTGELYIFWKSPWSSTQLSVSSCFSKSHWVSYDQIQVMTRCWLQMQGSFFLVSHIAHNKPRLENLKYHLDLSSLEIIHLLMIHHSNIYLYSMQRNLSQI